MAESTSNTQPFDEMAWLSPVARVGDLPREGVREGTMCFVDVENAVYQFRDGVWTTPHRRTPSPPQQR
jgi:hypothetical protein